MMSAISVAIDISRSYWIAWRHLVTSLPVCDCKESKEDREALVCGKSLGTDQAILVVPAKGRRRQSSASSSAQRPSTPRRTALHHPKHTECAVEPINCTRTHRSHGREQPPADRVHPAHHTPHERSSPQRKGTNPRIEAFRHRADTSTVRKRHQNASEADLVVNGKLGPPHATTAHFEVDSIRR